MVVVIVALFVAVVVVGVVLSRMSTSRKNEAMASLEAERKAIQSLSILDIVTAEVTDLGLRDIHGSEGIPPDALLRGWSDADPALHTEDRSHLRFVLPDDVAPTDAQIGDVRLARASSTLPPNLPEDDDGPNDTSGDVA